MNWIEVAEHCFQWTVRYLNFTRKFVCLERLRFPSGDATYLICGTSPYIELIKNETYFMYDKLMLVDII